MPLSLACMKCKPALERIQLGGKSRSKFQNCAKLWQSHFKNHREQRIVDQHNELVAFLEGREQEEEATNDEESISTASVLTAPTAQVTTPSDVAN